MSAADVLISVRGLLSEPERWLQHTLAQNEDGLKISVTHPRASSFSLDGAVFRVHWITRSPHTGKAYAILKRAIDPQSAVLVSSFNDALGTTHFAVLKMLDKAIRLAGGQVPVLEEKNE